MPVLNSVVYEDGRRVASIDLEQVAEHLATPGHFVWIALAEPTEGELEGIQRVFQLHDLPMEDVRRGNQRPKLEDYGNSLFVVMRPIEVDENVLRVGEMDVFVGANFLVSVRSGTDTPFTDVRERAERQPELLRIGPGFALYVLMDAVVDRYFPVLDDIESEIEAIEARMFSGPFAGASIQELYAVKQKLGVLKHATAPLLEAVSQITSSRSLLSGPDMRDYFRDVDDHLARIDSHIASDQDTVMTAIAASLSLLQLQDNQTTKRLASYGALIAVPTLIAGVYGMNFNHIPEFDWLLGYPFAIGLMAAADVWLFWRFRKVGWL